MATLKELIRKALQMTTPTGTMLPFAGKSVPEGWLLCNGAAVSRTTYAKLFAAIGTTWGAGDGSTTFNLPNCDGRFLEGTTNTSNVGTYLEAGLPNITGTTRQVTVINSHGVIIDGYGCFTNFSTFKDSGGTASVQNYTSGKLGIFSIDASKSSSIFGGSATVRPASAQTLIIIKI